MFIEQFIKNVNKNIEFIKIPLQKRNKISVRKYTYMYIPYKFV